ncbi:MAG: AAA family ATPase [Prevotellaceae bacterium]|jgi:hypothetical protein|nr:AAA family ATPase [Prevotellaceae bacterium]
MMSDNSNNNKENKQENSMGCLYLIAFLFLVSITLLFFVKGTVGYYGLAVSTCLLVFFLIQLVITPNKQKVKKEPPKLADDYSKRAELKRLKLEGDKRMNMGTKKAFSHLCARFDELAFSQKIWISRPTDDKKIVVRKEVLFKMGVFLHLPAETDLPLLRGEESSTYYLYPHGIVHSKSVTDFEFIPIEEVQISFARTHFTEKGAVPGDSVIKECKETGADNPMNPVAVYGEMTIKPLQVVYLVSNAEAAKNFVDAFNEFKTKITNGTIDETYFNTVHKAVENFYEFFEVLKQEPGFDAVLQETFVSFGQPDNDGQIPNWKDLALRNMLCCDVIKCYTELEHPIDFTSKEGLGLLLFMARFLAFQDRMEYSFLDIIRKAVDEKAIDKVNAFIDLHNVRAQETFLVAFLLEKYDKDLQKRYFVLLYRFASIIAKADGVISQAEEKWLSQLLQMEKSVSKETPPQKNGQMEENESVLQPIRNPREELLGLIGLSSVKSEITTQENFIKIQQARAQQGLKTSQPSYHIVFTGSPGTGKTTVARIVAEIYRELGILQEGHLKETDRSGLVAGYKGQTAIKTNKIIDEAINGILFIDEAYSLVHSENDDYGLEALATLIKRMEDDRDKLVVILAGYTKEMKTFIKSNSGLESRFNRYIEFPDYSADELYQIFEYILKKFDYHLAEGVDEFVKSFLLQAVESKARNFGNARFVRNLFEKTAERQANRLSKETHLTMERLSEISLEDIESVVRY